MSWIDWTARRVANVKDQELIVRDSIEKEIRISRHSQPAMSSIVDNTTHLRKESEEIGSGLDGRQHIRGTRLATRAKVFGNALKIAECAWRVDDVHRPCARQKACMVSSGTRS